MYEKSNAQCSHQNGEDGKKYVNTVSLQGPWGQASH